MKIELHHLPPRELSPNARMHWAKLYQAKKAATEEAVWLAIEQGRPKAPYACARMTITWVAKDRRRRDIDNLFASMKPYIDGLVQARLLTDDDAMHVSYTLRYERGDKDNTIIEVEEV